MEPIFRQWHKWAPQLLFNREEDLITTLDTSVVNEIFEHYFPEEGKSSKNKVPFKKIKKMI